MRTSVYFGKSFLALFTAAATYVHGFWAGGFLELRATSEYCADKPLAFPATSWSWLPLRHQCRWHDGGATDLVPWYVNPVVFICLVAAAVCMVLAIRTAHRNRIDDT
ncbi:hypothetical protein GCM10009555_049320 [Acrocarpospora macrocephala]|uniref:Uncharacterized protein n=1 Tax=Acrocarpospora macrocephala TaxID=150177 RepID=A0A5M3X5M0_9ACTN|nr:hypothetical protein [Acrocarpospora macrocephala]GES15872.1 hypothetical protein Amac_094700 [Acrocarpospora macrocephala]